MFQKLWPITKFFYQRLSLFHFLSIPLTLIIWGFILYRGTIIYSKKNDAKSIKKLKKIVLISLVPITCTFQPFFAIGFAYNPSIHMETFKIAALAFASILLFIFGLKYYHIWSLDLIKKFIVSLVLGLAAGLALSVLLIFLVEKVILPMDPNYTKMLQRFESVKKQID